MSVLIEDSDTGKRAAYFMSYEEFEKGPSIEQIIKKHLPLYWDNAKEHFPEYISSKNYGLNLKWGEEYDWNTGNREHEDD